MRKNALVTALAADAVYTTYSIGRHLRWETGGYDLGLFEQAVRHYAHFQPPYGELKGDGFNLLGDHFHPILVAIAPLYRLFPSPLTLLVVQAALIALSVYVVTSAAQRVLGERPGLLVGAAYALSWGIQAALDYEFHEIAFAVPMLALCIDNLMRERYRHAVCWAAGLVLVKEDLPITVVALGAVLWLLGKRRLGVGVAIFGVVAFVLIMFVALPAMSYWDHYTYWSYTGVTGERSTGERLADLVSATKLWGVLALLIPVAFLALRSPVTLLAAPTVAWHLVSSNPAYSSMKYHYALPLMPIVFLGTRDALRRNPRPFGRFTRYVPVYLLAIGVLSVATGPFGNMLRPSWWSHSPYARHAEAATSLVPDGARVAAHNRLAAHLTSDRTVFLLDRDLKDTTGRTLDVDWVVAETTGGRFPIDPPTRQRLLADLQGCGFVKVYDRDGFVTLRRVDPAARGEALAACLRS